MVRTVRTSVVLQVGGTLTAFLLLAAIPPADGRMLILPVSPGSAAGLPALAVAGGARLMGRGPLAGSLVVWGERSRLSGPLLDRGALLLAAPPAACGEWTAPAP